MSSKSSALRSRIGAPCLSMTVTPKLTRSTPTLNVCCRAAVTAALATANASNAAEKPPLLVRIRPPNGLEQFEGGHPEHLRPPLSVRVDALKPEAPLDCSEHAERSRQFRRRADASVTPKAAAKTRIVNPGRVNKSV